MSCKLTVDKESAEAFVKRYFSGKGINVDEVEITLPLVVAHCECSSRECPPIEPDSDLTGKA